MKTLSQCLMVLMLACVLPAWAAPVVANEHKSYEEMTAAEVRAEVQRLEQELINQAARLAGIPLTGDFSESTPSPSKEKASTETPQPKADVSKARENNAESVINDGNTQRRKPVRKLRRIHQEAQMKSENITEQQARKISMKTMIQNEVARLERERQQTERAGSGPKVVKLNPPPKAKGPDFVIADDSKREFVLELPLPSGKSRSKRKEKLKVRVKPEIMALHNQIQGLNQMLIDDVVRMTGKSLQKKKQTVVRRR